MKWYNMRGPEGTITCKGRHAGEAKSEAADRWECVIDEISVTGEEEYRGSGDTDCRGFASQ